MTGPTRPPRSWPGIARFESPAFADKLQLTTQLAQSSASSMINSAMGIGQAVITAVTFMITLVVINPVLALLTAAIAVLAIDGEPGHRPPPGPARG